MEDLLFRVNLLHHALWGLTYGDFSWAHCWLLWIYFKEKLLQSDLNPLELATSFSKDFITLLTYIITFMELYYIVLFNWYKIISSYAYWNSFLMWRLTPVSYSAQRLPKKKRISAIYSINDSNMKYSHKSLQYHFISCFAEPDAGF